MPAETDGAFGHAYNVQTTTAAEGKALVSIDVTQAGNDFEQLQQALDRVQRTLSCKPEQAVVDVVMLTVVISVRPISWKRQPPEWN